MKLTRRVLALILVATVACTSVVTATLVGWPIKFSWTIIQPTVSDLVCYETDGVTKLQTLSWGTMEQGKTYKYEFIVENDGTTALTLHLHKPNDAWVSGSWGTLSWDREGYVLSADETVVATLTWEISALAPTGTYTEGVNIAVEGS